MSDQTPPKVCEHCNAKVTLSIWPASGSARDLLKQHPECTCNQTPPKCSHSQPDTYCEKCISNFFDLQRDLDPEPPLQAGPPKTKCSRKRIACHHDCPNEHVDDPPQSAQERRDFDTGYWTIWIDDVDGQLAMRKTSGAVAKIEVVEQKALGKALERIAELEKLCVSTSQLDASCREQLEAAEAKCAELESAAEDDLKKCYDGRVKQREQLVKLTTLCEELAAVLSWYSEVSNYSSEGMNHHLDKVLRVDATCGDKARTALESYRKFKEGKNG